MFKKTGIIGTVFMLTVGGTSKVVFDVYYNAQLEKIQNVISASLQDIAPELNIFSGDLVSYQTLTTVLKTTFETLSGSLDLNTKTTIYQKSGLTLILSGGSVYVYTGTENSQPLYTLTPKSLITSKDQESELEKFPIPSKLKLVGQVYSENTELQKTLGIKTLISLIDSKNIIYSYLGTGEYNFGSKVKELGGNIVEIRSQKAIMKNNLFGDIASFINLPMRQGKKVILIVSIRGNKRLIEIPYDMYYDSKTYLNNLFN